MRSHLISIRFQLKDWARKGFSVTQSILLSSFLRRKGFLVLRLMKQYIQELCISSITRCFTKRLQSRPLKWKGFLHFYHLILILATSLFPTNKFHLITCHLILWTTSKGAWRGLRGISIETFQYCCQKCKQCLHRRITVKVTIMLVVLKYENKTKLSF